MTSFATLETSHLVQGTMELATATTTTNSATLWTASIFALQQRNSGYNVAKGKVGVTTTQVVLVVWSVIVAVAVMIWVSIEWIVVRILLVVVVMVMSVPVVVWTVLLQV